MKLDPKGVSNCWLGVRLSSVVNTWLQLGSYRYGVCLEGLGVLEIGWEAGVGVPVERAILRTAGVDAADGRNGGVDDADGGACEKRESVEDLIASCLKLLIG